MLKIVALKIGTKTKMEKPLGFTAGALERSAGLGE